MFKRIFQYFSCLQKHLHRPNFSLRNSAKKLAEFPKLISYSIKELTYACTASVYRSRAVAS